MRTAAYVLLIIGGLNWGLIGFFEFDLVAAIFGGQTSALSRIIYSLVGISAVYELFNRGRSQPAAGSRTRLSTDEIDRAA